MNKAADSIETLDGKISSIPFNLLVLSEKNVRKVSPSKEKDKQLLASVKARGILQNLIVFENKKVSLKW